MTLPKSKGFSLMEVVVALAILGIAVTAIIELYSISLKSTKKTLDYSQAIVYARSYLDEAYSMPALKEAEESFEQPDGMRVVRSVRLYSSEEDMKVYEISVTVSWPPKGSLEIKGRRSFYEAQAPSLAGQKKGGK